MCIFVVFDLQAIHGFFPFGKQRDKQNWTSTPFSSRISSNKSDGGFVSIFPYVCHYETVYIYISSGQTITAKASVRRCMAFRVIKFHRWCHDWWTTPGNYPTDYPPESIVHTPPQTNMTTEKTNIWRCISFWTWGLSHCHVSFRGGVQYYC